MIGHLLAAELFLLCISSTCDAKTDYCTYNCNGEKNSACGNKCEKAENTIEEIAPDFTFRKRMLDRHNYLRNLLAGGQNTSGGNGESSNMMVLSYNMNLEFSIACWVYRAGTMKHDKCRGSPDFMNVGQNLYMGTQGNPATEEGVNLICRMWFEELTLVQGSWIDTFPPSENRSAMTKGKDTGHFTQLVWATTTHIGCAGCKLKDIDKKGKIKYLVGCNYGPAGNEKGGTVYLRGKPTSACPSGTGPNKEYPNLCGEIKIPDAAKITGNAEFKEYRNGAASMNKNVWKYKVVTFAGLLLTVWFLNHSF